MEPHLAKIAEEIKKIPFSPSWQSNFSSDRRRVINLETKQIEEKEFQEFLYVPAPNIVRHFSSDKNFLYFRTENKGSKDYDFGFIPDKFENNNRRLAVWYVADMLGKLNIGFMIDESYTIYILVSELAKFANSEHEELRKLYMHLAIPKQLARKTGVREEWGV